MPAPQGLPRAQGGLEPTCAAVVRGGSTSMRTALIRYPARAVGPMEIENL